MDIEAVVFDMDGVLVDSEPMHYASTNEVLSARGAFLEQSAYDACRGMSESAFFGLLVKKFSLDEDPERLAHERIRASLNRLASQTLLPMEGALDCLLALSIEGYRLGLASAARKLQVDLVVDKLGVRRLLGAVVSLDDVARGKPAPDLFLEAARQLDCDPARCLVVEDAVHGVEAAVRAGMAVVALPPKDDDGASHQEAGALQCLGSLAELTPEFLEAWVVASD
ncbi:MAG: HAD family phosphatase [Planctomycetota bacterium]|nr:HAD family phosphatase [Planctomycetota bacterium]